MSKTILLVDDDALLRRSLAFNLERAGYRVLTSATAEDGIARIHQEHPDLVLLDIGLPGMDGLDALREIHGQHEIPVIMLTARRRELDEVLGLELGADDYITKPFDLNVLLAHIKAVLRRWQTPTTPLPASANEILEVGAMRIDPEAHTAFLGSAELKLSPREFSLLRLLVENAGKLVTTEDLLSRVWGAEFAGQPQVVYVHIRWLREKVEADPMTPQHIQTVRRLGYKFVP